MSLPFEDVLENISLTILDDDEVVRLKEWPPHLEEIQVPYGGDHNVKFIL